MISKKSDKRPLTATGQDNFSTVNSKTEVVQLDKISRFVQTYLKFLRSWELRSARRVTRQRHCRC
jgi:hypothetical protein